MYIPIMTPHGLLSPQNLQALRAQQVLNLKAHKQLCGPLAQGPALFQPLHYDIYKNDEESVLWLKVITDK